MRKGRRYNPTSPGRRFQTSRDLSGLSKEKSPRALTGRLNAKTGGRNGNGRITTRHRGGGHKRLYREVDFRRDKVGIPSRVASIDYDPNRSANLALL